MLGWSSPSTRRLRARVSSSSSRAAWCLAQLAQVDGEVAGGARGCRGGPRPARGGGGPGCLRPAPGPPGVSPSSRRSMARLLAECERVGVVLAQHAAVPGQGVFVQFPGRLVLAQRVQVEGEVVGGGEGVGVVLAEHAAAAGQGVFAAAGVPRRSGPSARKAKPSACPALRVSGSSGPRRSPHCRYRRLARSMAAAGVTAQDQVPGGVAGQPAQVRVAGGGGV